jgi:hypothetical protein
MLCQTSTGMHRDPPLQPPSSIYRMGASPWAPVNTTRMLNSKDPKILPSALGIQ